MIFDNKQARNKSNHAHDEASIKIGPSIKEPGVCRALDIKVKIRLGEDRFVDLAGNSCSITQKSGEIWTFQTDLQQIYSKSGRPLFIVSLRSHGAGLSWPQ